MNPHNEEHTEAWMRQRSVQLRNQLDEISGGTATFGYLTGENLPPEVEIQFLEHVLSFELAEDTTWKEQLDKMDYSMPAPELLTEEAVATEVWEVIQRLGEMHCYLEMTNHLSDRELYEKLYTLLDEPTEDYRMMAEGASCHLQVLLSGEEEDDLIWLKYYADEETRQMWHHEFDIALPPKAEAPYDRDQHLPHPFSPDA